MEIITPRLVLKLYTAESLRYWKNSREAFEQYTGLTVSGLHLEDWALKELDDAFDFWINNIEKYPDQIAWYSGREIILQSENRGIGGIGFAGPPDEKGEVLIGYHLDLRFRGKGLASEALETMTEWAFLSDSVQSVAATIPDWNLPSQKLAERCGFRAMEQKFAEGMNLIVYRRLR